MMKKRYFPYWVLLLYHNLRRIMIILQYFGDSVEARMYKYYSVIVI